MKSKGFGYVAGADARVLILGTLPGKVSQARCQYYAHPRNEFWRIMGELVGASSDLPYEDRLCKLKEYGIALWDVCAAAHRHGSNDSKIKLSSVETNDIGGFLRTHPGVGLISFNGKKAKEIYARKVPHKPCTIFERIRYEVLPSTSPAYAMRHGLKLSRWRCALLGEGGASGSLGSGVAARPSEKVETHPCHQGSPS